MLDSKRDVFYVTLYNVYTLVQCVYIGTMCIMCIHWYNVYTLVQCVYIGTIDILITVTSILFGNAIVTQ